MKPSIQGQINRLLTQKNVTFDVNIKEIENIPINSPLVCICNQLHGQIDEWLLIKIFLERNLSFKVISAFGPYLKIFNEFYYSSELKIVEQLSLVLKEDVQIIIIPVDFNSRKYPLIRKSRRINKLLKIIKQANLAILPIKFYSSAPNIPQKLLELGSRFFPKLQNETLSLVARIGKPILPEELWNLDGTTRTRKYLQSRIYSLGSNLEVKRFFRLPLFKKPEVAEPLCGAIDASIMLNEIRGLALKNFILSQGVFDLYVASATEIPNILMEIGRLREKTFRGVGEGTGKARDLDEFDVYYEQLIIWDREANKIVGGYRLGRGDMILSKYGVEGLYTYSLFKIKQAFYPILRQSVELGRSYIVEEYQKQRWPLFLLWKGILHFIIKNPQYRYLYGPMSISKYYSNISKSLIIAFVKKHFYNHELANYIKPRTPFKYKDDQVNVDLLMGQLGDTIKNLDNLIEDIEPNHFKIPVLMRQYIKLNARFISFNVDPSFNDVLDGLMLLDMNDLPIEMLEALRN